MQAKQGSSTVVQPYIIFVESTEMYSQHAHSVGGGDSSSSPTTTTIPICRTSEEEKKVTVIKAPHYAGIGPVDESGIPTAIRTVGNVCVCFCVCALHTMNVLLTMAFSHSSWLYITWIKICTIRVTMGKETGIPEKPCFNLVAISTTPLLGEKLFAPSFKTCSTCSKFGMYCHFYQDALTYPVTPCVYEWTEIKWMKECKHPPTKQSLT